MSKKMNGEIGRLVQRTWLFSDGLHVAQVISVDVLFANVTLCFATLMRMLLTLVQDLTTLAPLHLGAC